jgi:hypothetical protein
VKFIHRVFIRDPKVNEEGAGKPGGKAQKVDQKIAFGPNEIPVYQQKMMFQHGIRIIVDRLSTRKNPEGCIWRLFIILKFNLKQITSVAEFIEFAMEIKTTMPYETLDRNPLQR